MTQYHRLRTYDRDVDGYGSIREMSPGDAIPDYGDKYNAITAISSRAKVTLKTRRAIRCDAHVKRKDAERNTQWEVYVKWHPWAESADGLEHTFYAKNSREAHRIAWQYGKDGNIASVETRKIA